MRTDEIKLTVLEPDDGMVLTNGETYSTRVYLGVGDSALNWREVPEEVMRDGIEVIPESESAPKSKLLY